MSTMHRPGEMMNPDEDFVLHGRPASYWGKSGSVSNSRNTTTTARLSQHVNFDPDNYPTKIYARTLGDVASNLQLLSERVSNVLSGSYDCGAFLPLQTESPILSPRPTPLHSPQYQSPRHSPCHSPRFSPRHSPQHSPCHSPRFSPRHSPQHSPCHSPRFSPRHSPQHSPCHSPRGRTSDKSVQYRRSDLTKYSPEKFSDPSYTGKSAFELGQGQVRASLSDTILTNITEDELAEQYEKFISSNTFAGKPVTPRETEWFIQPRHFFNKPSPSLQSVGLRKRLGESKAESFYSEDDKIALENFPVTFGTVYDLVDKDYPDAEVMAIYAPPSMRKSRSMIPSRLKRSKSCSGRNENDGTCDVDKMYFMSKEAPATKSADIYRSTPQQISLGKLRMERLRLEEQKLLHLKQLEEVERLRGPTPKWYESKGLDFHYESKKNTKMLRSSKNFKQLQDYREDLLRAYMRNAKLNSKTSHEY